ncbi:hypothetical protein F4780DRAFT_711149 [Xylariomycetidae sp. FL0641]|nr:hypothetical protein F4780DRAFT_711149 [Xylariomycetidae sp. FL0641]
MSSISPLPDSATRLLSSHVVITSPVTLVKELVDNSIDAEATSVEILISSDTVSKIEVRDNGVGIHPDDYDSLGRRSHTSKLREIKDLESAFSISLGFRGEALASINCMANITVTTKTPSEPVAAILHLVPNVGGVDRQQATSAPIGTTVVVTSLFGRLPVREQAAIKEAKKTLDKIQELLRSYAMARPRLKLSFKVLREPGKNWTYSPKSNATAKEAVLQMFGTYVAACCLEKTVTVVRSSPDKPKVTASSSTSSAPNYTLEAVLLEPGSSARNLATHRYFSVDSRPLNAQRGTNKKLLDIYKEHLQRSPSNPSDAFIRLNIICPPGSYDANVEPSKDDVLFSDENTVLYGFRELCSGLYGSVDVRQETSASSPDLKLTKGAQAQSNIPPASMRTLPNSSKLPDVHLQCIKSQHTGQPALATEREDMAFTGSRTNNVVDHQRTAQPAPFYAGNTSDTTRKPLDECEQNVLPQSQPKATTQVPCMVDMSEDLSGRPERYRQKRQKRENTKRDVQPDHEAGADSSTENLNPWTLSKPRARNTTVSSIGPDSTMPSFEPPMTPDPPILQHLGASPGDLALPPTHGLMNAQRAAGQSLLVPGGAYRSPVSSSHERPSKYIASNNHDRPSLKPRPRQHLPPWTPPSAVETYRQPADQAPDSSQTKATKNLKQPKISFSGTRKNHDRGREHEVESGVICPPLHGRMEPGLHTDEVGNSPALAYMAKRHLEYQLSHSGNQAPDDVPNQPEQVGLRTYTSRRQPRNNSSKYEQQAPEDKEPLKTSLAVGDPRAYLLRRQKSMAAVSDNAKLRKLRRLKSQLMPLENVPCEQQVHSLAQHMTLDTDALLKHTEILLQYDTYVGEGAFEDGLEACLGRSREIEDRLKSVLASFKENSDIPDCEIHINLSSLQTSEDATDGF